MMKINNLFVLNLYHNTFVDFVILYFVFFFFFSILFDFLNRIFIVFVLVAAYPWTIFYVLFSLHRIKTEGALRCVIRECSKIKHTEKEEIEKIKQISFNIKQYTNGINLSSFVYASFVKRNCECVSCDAFVRNTMKAQMQCK